MCGVGSDADPGSSGRDAGGLGSLLEGAVMTAEQIVARIQKTLLDQKIAWRAQTVDTFKAGSPRRR